MGSFQTYTFVGGRWSNEGDSIDAPFLRVSIHDSDIAIVTYAPGPISGGWRTSDSSRETISRTPERAPT